MSTRPNSSCREIEPRRVFDGVSPELKVAVALKLKSVERRANDGLWIRYEVVRS